MNQKKLVQAIALVVTSGALGISNAQASSTYYGTYAPINGDWAPDHRTDAAQGPGLLYGFSSNTDGWTTNAGPDNNGAVLPWLGTSGGARPFGYTGSSALNWAAEITHAGDSLEISQDDAAQRYGTTWSQDHSNALVDLDTAKGAWYDGATGWGHNTDIGLFKSSVTTLVTLNLTALFNASETVHWSNFGVTVFTGMDTGANYTHHYGWNDSSLPYTNSNPGGTTGVIYDGSIGVSTPGQAYSATVDSTNGFTFLAQAGQVYSIYLGGNSGSGNFDPHAGYQLNITTAPVPVPGAAWLFGSGLLGMLRLLSKKR